MSFTKMPAVARCSFTVPTQGRCDQALVTAQLCRQACSSVRPCTRHWQLYEVLPTLERCQAVTASLEVECMGACWAANTPQAATTDVPTRVPVRFSRHSMRSTPLHIAVGYSQLQLTAALLEAGADPEARTPHAAGAADA